MELIGTVAQQAREASFWKEWEKAATESATRVNIALIAFQMLVLVFFVFFSLRHVIDDSGIAGVVDPAPFWNSMSTLSAALTWKSLRAKR